MAFENMRDRLEQDNPTLQEGEYLVARTLSDGYTGVVHGNQLYEVQPYGTGGLKVVPVITSEDGFSYVSESDKPCVIYNATDRTVTYILNAREEVYHPPYPKIDELAEGDSANKKIMFAFMAYAKDKYRIGVNDFQIADHSVFFEATTAPDAPNQPTASNTTETSTDLTW